MIHKKLGYVAAAAMVSLMVAACSAEVGDCYAPNMDSMEYVTAFGKLDSDQMCIVADNGTSLHIAEIGAQSSEEEIDEREGRVLVNYTILGNSAQGGFDVRLNCFYPLEVKDMEIYRAGTSDSEESVYAAVAESEPEWKDGDFVSLLEAPAIPYEVSVGGGYINVNVCYTSTIAPTEEVPYVDLYYDSDSSTGDTAVLQLVAEPEEEMYDPSAKTRFRWFSFRIVDEIFADVQSADIYAFYWCWWLEEGNPNAGIEEHTSVMHSNFYGSSAERIIKLVSMPL